MKEKNNILALSNSILTVYWFLGCVYGAISAWVGDVLEPFLCMDLKQSLLIICSELQLVATYIDWVINPV